MFSVLTVHLTVCINECDLTWEPVFWFTEKWREKNHLVLIFIFLEVRDVSSGDHAACYTSALSLHCCFDALALLLCRGKYIQLQVGHIRIFSTRIQPNLSHYFCLSHWAMCCWSEVNKSQWCPALPASIAFNLLLVWSPWVSNKGYRYNQELVLWPAGVLMYWFMWVFSLVAMIPERSFHIVERQVIIW